MRAMKKEPKAMVAIVGWEHCCDATQLRGYTTVVVAGQVVVFCQRCGASRWVPCASLRGATPAQADRPR